MAVTWDKALYDLAYNLLGEPEGHPNTRKGIRLHYNRAAMYPMMQRRAQQLIEILGLTTADRILMIGCGFGWTVEALIALGYTVVGTDISAFIQGNKAMAEDNDISAAITAVGLDPASGHGLAKFDQLKGDGIRTRAVILDEDSTTPGSRNKVKNALGTPTVVITEDLLPSLTDLECAALHADILKYAATVRICHFLSEFANPDPPFNLNSKSIEDWKLLFPTATIVADGYTFKVA